MALPEILGGVSDALAVSTDWIGALPGPDVMELWADDELGWNPFKAGKKFLKKHAKYAVYAGPAGLALAAANPKAALRGAKGAVHQAGKLSKNPYVVAAAGAVAVAFPPAAPAVGAVMVAARLAAALDSKLPKKRRAAAIAIKNTIALAKRGDANARRAAQTISDVRRLQRGKRGNQPKFAVTRDAYTVRVA